MSHPVTPMDTAIWHVAGIHFEVNRKQQSGATLVRGPHGESFRLGATETWILQSCNGITVNQLMSRCSTGSVNSLVVPVVDMALRHGLLTCKHVSATGTAKESVIGRLFKLVSFAPILVVNPSNLLDRMHGRVGFLLYGAGVRWLALLNMILGLVALLNAIVRQTPGSFLATLRVSPASEVAIAAAMLVTLILHEVAHGLTLVHYGGRVDKMGIGLLCLVPVPYTDVTGVWLLTNRRQRINVLAAGIIFQIQTSAFACVLTLTPFADTHPEVRSDLFIYAALNFLLVVFNLNPLLKLDGHWLLAAVRGDSRQFSAAIEASAGVLVRGRTLGRRELIFGLFGLMAVLYTFWSVLSWLWVLWNLVRPGV